jgi:hypothetical protein
VRRIEDPRAPLSHTTFTTTFVERGTLGTTG